MSNRQTTLIPIPEFLEDGELVPLINERLLRIDQHLGYILSRLDGAEAPSQPVAPSRPTTVTPGTSAYTWPGAANAWYGIPLFWQVVWELTENTMITSPVQPRPGYFLVLYVVADPTSFYTLTFDSEMFVNSPADSSPDPGKVTVHVFTGRDDGKWWPIQIPRTGVDPTA